MTNAHAKFFYGRKCAQMANQANNQSLTPSTDMTDTTHLDSEDGYSAGC